MDDENNGKPYEQMDDFGGTIIFGNTRMDMYIHVAKFTLLIIFLLRMLDGSEILAASR